MASAGRPNQWALKEACKLPCNNQLIAWPMPQPGHQVMPASLNRQRVKRLSPAGLVMANDARAVSQNINSKFFFIILINTVIRLVHEQQCCRQ